MNGRKAWVESFALQSRMIPFDALVVIQYAPQENLAMALHLDFSPNWSIIESFVRQSRMILFASVANYHPVLLDSTEI